MIEHNANTPERVVQIDIAALTSQLQNHSTAAVDHLEIAHGIDGLVFYLNMANDPVQNSLRRGEFYELIELERLKAVTAARPSVLDIGANIGNHALYFATRMQAKKVVVIEPNPLALPPLLANIILNNLEDQIDIRHLGFGLSDVAEGGYWMKKHAKNLGATKMQAGGGDIPVKRGDEIFADQAFDLIKIDVEGMEISVLHGLQETIEKSRPIMLIEVDQKNEAIFELWMDINGYQEVFTHSHSAKNRNILALPKEAGNHNTATGPKKH